MRYQANTPKPWRLTKSTRRRTTNSAAINATTKPIAISPAPSEGGRQKGDHDVRDKALLGSLCGQPGGGMQQPLAIDPAHGQDRAQLDHDVEQLAFRSFETEQPVGEDQMAGRGDRQEFGQSLDDAEEDGGGEEGGEHDLVGAAGCRQRLPTSRRGSRPRLRVSTRQPGPSV